MDEMFDLIIYLQAFIHIMAMVLMVPIVFVSIPSGGWSIHSSSWRELILDLHKDFGPESIQEGIVVEPWRGRLQRASNLSQAVVTWRFFPFSFVLLPFFLPPFFSPNPSPLSLSMPLSLMLTIYGFIFG